MNQVNQSCRKNVSICWVVIENGYSLQDLMISELQSLHTVALVESSGRCPTSPSCTPPHGHTASPSMTTPSTPASASPFPATDTCPSTARPTATPHVPSTPTSTRASTGTGPVSKPASSPKAVHQAPAQPL